MAEIRYRPADRSALPRQMALIFVPFALLVLFGFLDNWPERFGFIVFAGLFALIVHRLLRWQAAQNRHPLVFDDDGLSHAALLERYGSERIPWREVESIDLIHGARTGTWLRLELRPGRFRDGLKRPLGDRLAGKDVNLPLDFKTAPEDILSAARRFLGRQR